MDCRICLENIENDDFYLQLTCGHSFHYDCINKMQNNLCPLCRKDNTELLEDNGIVREQISDDDSDNDSDSDNDNYDDSDSYDDSSVFSSDIDYEFLEECLNSINNFVIGENYDEDFIDNIKNLNIVFNEHSLERARNLYDALQEYGLKIREDSIKCIDFIKYNKDTLENVTNIMVEMN